MNELQTVDVCRTFDVKWWKKHFFVGKNGTTAVKYCIKKNNYYAQSTYFTFLYLQL